jgi:hypothetical protein
VTRRGCIGKIPLTRIQFATHDAYSGEFLLEDDCAEAIAAFIESLTERRFGLIALNGIEPGSVEFSSVEESARRYGLDIETTNHPNAVVDLRNGYEGYCQSMSRNFRRTVKRQADRVNAAGTVRVDGVRLDCGVDRLELCIERLIRVTEASYKLNGNRLADSHREYLAGLARRFGARGMLHLSLLSIGGRDAAVVMGLVERGCYYDITLAYDEQFAAISPGAFLMQDTLRDLAERGMRTLISHGAH